MNNNTFDPTAEPVTFPEPSSSWLKNVFYSTLILVTGIGVGTGIYYANKCSELEETLADYQKTNTTIVSELGSTRKKLVELDTTRFSLSGRLNQVNLQREQCSTALTQCWGNLAGQWYTQFQHIFSRSSIDESKLDYLLTNYLTQMGGQTLGVDRNHPEAVFEAMCNGFSKEKDYSSLRTKFTDWFTTNYFNQAAADNPTSPILYFKNESK